MCITYGKRLVILEGYFGTIELDAVLGCFFVVASLIILDMFTVHNCKYCFMGVVLLANKVYLSLYIFTLTNSLSFSPVTSNTIEAREQSSIPYSCGWVILFF